MANQKNIDAKKEQVSKLAEEFKNANLVLLTQYRGINVEQDTALRHKIRDTKSNYRVIKNNIIRRALNENSVNELDEVLAGPTAVILNNEEYLEPAKAVYEFMKENDFYEIKGGIIEGKVMSAEEIITLAKLPSKEQLYSMLAGSLLANISKLAVALGQVAQKQEN